MARARTYTSASLYHKIRQDFQNGLFKYGERITEIGLSERYHTSRTPLREALIKLEKDGLIERKPNGRINILELSKDGLIEILNLRFLMEETLLKKALEQESTRTQLLNDMMHNLNDVDYFLKEDKRDQAHKLISLFHALPQKYVKMKHTVRIIDNYDFLMYPLQKDSLLNTDRLVQAQAEHRHMYDLISVEDWAGLNKFYIEHTNHFIEKMLLRLDGLSENNPS